MKCPKDREIQRLIDRRLEPDQTEQVNAHIESCVNCREAYARTVKLRKLIKDTFAEEVEAQDLSPVWAGVNRHIADSRQTKSKQSPLSALYWTVFRRPALALASSTVLVLIVFAIIFFNFLPGRSGSGEAAVIIESIVCDDSDIIITIDAIGKDRTPVVYISGLENGKGAQP